MNTNTLQVVEEKAALPFTPFQEEAAVKVFVVNLRTYNEGETVGEWFSLPCEVETIKNAIGINEEYEEHAIHDYEAPFSIGEYDSLDNLNEIAEQLSFFDEDEIQVYKLMRENLNHDHDRAYEGVRHYEYRIFDKCNDMSDVAFDVVEESGMLDSCPENVKSYFDYEVYGRDLDIEGTYIKVNHNTYIELFEC